MSVKVFNEEGHLIDQVEVSSYGMAEEVKFEAELQGNFAVID